MLYRRDSDNVLKPGEDIFVVINKTTETELTIQKHGLFYDLNVSEIPMPIFCKIFDI